MTSTPRLPGNKYHQAVVSIFQSGETPEARNRRLSLELAKRREITRSYCRFQAENEESGASVEKEVCSDLEEASRVGGIDEVRRHLSKSGHSQDDLQSALYQAAKRSHLDMVKALVAAGARPDTRVEATQSGAYPIHGAACGGLRVVDYFLTEYPSCSFAKDKSGRLPAHYAAQHGYPFVLHYLLMFTDDVDLADSTGHTCLHYAARTGREEAVKVLINRGASTIAQDSDGMTPYHFACKGGSRECMQLLSKAGADRQKRSHDGKTGLDVAHKSAQAYARLALGTGRESIRADEKAQTFGVPTVVVLMVMTAVLGLMPVIYWQFITPLLAVPLDVMIFAQVINLWRTYPENLPKCLSTFPFQIRLFLGGFTYHLGLTITLSIQWYLVVANESTCGSRYHPLLFLPTYLALMTVCNMRRPFTPFKSKDPLRALEIHQSGEEVPDEFCNSCMTFRSENVKHCPQCRRCVDVFDHHCFLVGTCVGKENRSPFVALLVVGVLAGCAMVRTTWDIMATSTKWSLNWERGTIETLADSRFVWDIYFAHPVVLTCFAVSALNLMFISIILATQIRLTACNLSQYQGMKSLDRINKLAAELYAKGASKEEIESTIKSDGNGVFSGVKMWSVYKTWGSVLMEILSVFRSFPPAALCYGLSLFLMSGTLLSAHIFILGFFVFCRFKHNQLQKVEKSE